MIAVVAPPATCPVPGTRNGVLFLTCRAPGRVSRSFRRLGCVSRSFVLKNADFWRFGDRCESALLGSLQSSQRNRKTVIDTGEKFETAGVPAGNFSSVCQTP